ncbi:hypothetical protein Plhal304r1_c009g0034761 [Plasmopara halstedii]
MQLLFLEMYNTMDEEDEFGMSKMTRDADPMELEVKSAVKDHPDFRFLDVDELCAAIKSEDKRLVPLWMMCMPVQRDLSQWTILEAQIRPDRSWDIIKELIATVCMSKGLLVMEEHTNSMLFRKKIMQESVAHGISDSITYLNVYVHIDVSPSKLRVVNICALVSAENNLLSGMVSTGRHALWEGQDRKQSHKYVLDNLLGALQATMLSQCLSLSDLYMSTPENSMDTVDKAELDEGYIADVKRAFSSEMKAHMRDLCIPLESYAFDQEFACAMLIGLLEPTLKKYGIKLTGTKTRSESSKSNASSPAKDVEALFIPEDVSAFKGEKKPCQNKLDLPSDIKILQSLRDDVTTSLIDQTTSSQPSKIYGEVVSDLVQNLWRVCKEDCELRLRAKFKEKQEQVSIRVESVQHLRTQAIQAIIEVDGAQQSNLHQAPGSDRSNVLLYEASCMANGIPVTLHVTSGCLIYRTMVPVFAHTTVVEFKDVLNVKQTTSFGIQVVYLELDPTKHAKGLTIAMGLEVDLLYQLLHELYLMHQCKLKSSISSSMPPLQQQETEKDPIEMKKILGSEEETKEDETSPAPESNTDANAISSKASANS